MRPRDYRIAADDTQEVQEMPSITKLSLSLYCDIGGNCGLSGGIPSSDGPRITRIERTKILSRATHSTRVEVFHDEREA